jgi:hypothetical protein
VKVIKGQGYKKGVKVINKVRNNKKLILNIAMNLTKHIPHKLTKINYFP